jgi:hypothetical protein
VGWRKKTKVSSSGNKLAFAFSFAGIRPAAGLKEHTTQAQQGWQIAPPAFAASS